MGGNYVLGGGVSGVAGATLAIWFGWANCDLWAPAFAGVTCWACLRVLGGGDGFESYRGCLRCRR